MWHLNFDNPIKEYTDIHIASALTNIINSCVEVNDNGTFDIDIGYDTEIIRNLSPTTSDSDAITVLRYAATSYNVNCNCDSFHFFRPPLIYYEIHIGCMANYGSGIGRSLREAACRAIMNMAYKNCRGVGRYKDTNRLLDVSYYEEEDKNARERAKQLLDGI